ncbi:DUF1273 domain-containing protein [Sporolactobacillus sp. THM7-4]|nr:DUF1273 domain-containing protein [Sporolactobacillus sp. THM7-4]
MSRQEAVLVTGYKPHELGIFSADHPGIPVIRYGLKVQMRQLAGEGAKWFVISGQPGVELWAADVCLELKREERLDVRLAVLPPFLDQEERYPGWVREQYDKILQAADFSEPISNRPYQSPLQLRQKNDFLTEKTDALLILYDEEKPGSPDYYLTAARRKAQKQSYPIFFIDRYDLDTAAEEWKEQSPDYWSQM